MLAEHVESGTVSGCSHATKSSQVGVVLPILGEKADTEALHSRAHTQPG